MKISPRSSALQNLGFDLLGHIPKSVRTRFVGRLFVDSIPQRLPEWAKAVEPSVIFDEDCNGNPIVKTAGLSILVFSRRPSSCRKRMRIVQAMLFGVITP
jgi:hypothetical protein